ncbi:MAG: alpha-galactosidase [Acidobacteriota bacterium]|nr:alpha-galactosidase [Acidobacteriota bacterium]
MRKLAYILALLVPACLGAASPFQFDFDLAQNRWNLTNGVITATLELTPNGNFQLDSLAHSDGTVWTPPPDHPSSPLHFAVGDLAFDENTRYVLVNQFSKAIARGGFRQMIVLRDSENRVQVTLRLELFRNQPVLRHSVTVQNLTSDQVFITAADMLPWAFADNGSEYTSFTVDQWSILQPRALDFQISQTKLNGVAGKPAYARSGAHGSQCGWVAVRDPSGHGLFAGWEFNGRSEAFVQHSGVDNTLRFSAPVDALHHPVAPGAAFAVPPAFLGLFRGNWDEAGYRTQRFSEAALARAAPGGAEFPYLVWDSWAYQQQLSEDLLRRNADVAAQVGVELFIVDLGWAQRLGDWYADPVKFPSGLRALSDYVHSKGMLFGLHLTPGEVATNSTVIQLHPDWASTEQDHYFKGVSLCLSNAPAQQWIVDQIKHVIDDYNVDWILQDGENMVKKCTRADHTHDPQDSNYANAEQGIDAVVEAVLQSHPSVAWENCENGGNMMTFKMVRNYVTSILNDASGALASRVAAYGATYPFSPRYADRYSPEDPTSVYNTRSYMFGGPWHLMDRLADLNNGQLIYASWEFARYKAVRELIRNGKVFHLSAPGDGKIDALEAYDAATDSAAAIVTREGGETGQITIKLLGLKALHSYSVTFANDPQILVRTGAQLAQDGVEVSLPDSQTAEIVYAVSRL